jgi:hypothetical protein
MWYGDLNANPLYRWERNHELKHIAKQMSKLSRLRVLVSFSLYNLEPIFDFPPWI